MTCCWILSLMLMLVSADDPQKPVIEQDRARRAAIVDRIMGEPTAPHFRINQTLTTELVDLNEAVGEGEKNEQLIKKQQPVQELMVILERENFDRWIFGNMTNDQKRRAWLEHRLRSKSEQVAKTITLSRPQIEKLQLAGRGDIKRFFDRVEEMRPEFDVARKDMDEGRLFLLNDVKPLCTQFQLGPFGDDSLFARTLRKIENDALAARQIGQ